MYATERQQRILAIARGDGRVEVLSLAELLGVTTETIRRDLTALERLGTLRRVHGGALPVERAEIEPTVATRTTQHSEAKRRIAARALEELPAEGTVLLDGGTTTRLIADLLPRTSRLTVVTNNLDAAQALEGRDEIDLYLLGGRVRGRTGASVGAWLTSALEQVCVDVAFLGSNGFSLARGMTTPDQAEANAKRAMVAAARRAVVLADSTKAGVDHFHRFAALTEVAMLITDADLDDETADDLAEAGPEVVRA